jgi:hypothetical protein
MAYPVLKFGDISKIWGYLAAAAKAQQATRSVLQVSLDSVRSVGAALHLPVEPPDQQLTLRQQRAKAAYNGVMHARNLFDGYAGKFVSNNTMMRIQDAHAEKLIKIYLYLQQHGSQTELGKAMDVLDQNGWTDQIANMSLTYDGTFPN